MKRKTLRLVNYLLDAVTGKSRWKYPVSAQQQTEGTSRTQIQRCESANNVIHIWTDSNQCPFHCIVYSVASTRGMIFLPSKNVYSTASRSMSLNNLTWNLSVDVCGKVSENETILTFTAITSFRGSTSPWCVFKKSIRILLPQVLQNLCVLSLVLNS